MTSKKDGKTIIIDFDETLTNESFAKSLRKEGMDINDHDKVKDVVSKFTPKKGVEILKLNEIDPVIVTGRQEALRDVSTIWLYTHDIPFKELIMIPNGYYGKEFDWDKYVKYKIWAHKRYDVRFSIDDNEKLVTILKDRGVPIFLVGDDFAKTFREAWEATV